MIIVQISDAHLCPEGDLLHGISDPVVALTAAVTQINAMDPAPDLVIFTGDLTEDGLTSEYAVAARLLGELRAPLRILPGNHDDREGFRSAFAAGFDLPAQGPLHWVADDFGPLRVIGLDVTVPGDHHGRIEAAHLAWLEAALARAPDRPTLLAMHQPPILTGITFMDRYRCYGEQGLLELISRFPSVQRVACGHVHRAMHCGFGPAILCTAPSLSPAIALRLAPDAQPASLTEPAAMLVHHWQGAQIMTHHLPIGPFPGPFAFF